jgi:hypothetical protein
MMTMRRRWQRWKRALGLAPPEVPSIYGRLIGPGPDYRFREVVWTAEGWRDGPLRGIACHAGNESVPEWDGMIAYLYAAPGPHTRQFYTPFPAEPPTVLDFQADSVYGAHFTVIDLVTGRALARPVWYADASTGLIRAYRNMWGRAWGGAAGRMLELHPDTGERVSDEFHHPIRIEPIPPA